MKDVESMFRANLKPNQFSFWGFNEILDFLFFLEKFILEKKKIIIIMNGEKDKERDQAATKSTVFKYCCAMGLEEAAEE